MTDIIKFNEEHTPKTEIGKMKFQLAEALNTITDLQNGYIFPKLTATERHEKFNKAMITVCDILGIDLDMHELLKTGSEGFRYSDTEDDTKALGQLVNTSRSHGIKTKLFTLFTLASGLSHSDMDFISVDDKGTETPTTQQELAKALRTNLVELTESLGLSVDQVTESHTEQAQDTVKSIIQNIKDISARPSEYAGEDMDVLGDLVYSYVSDLCNVLGFEDMSDSEAPTNEYGEKQQSIKDILLALHEDLTNEDLNPVSLRDFGRIHVYDLADLLGIEELSSVRDIHIVEGEQWLKATAEKLADQEVYDSLPAEDKLNVDMLNKLHEVQDHVLRSGQDAVSMNQVQTAISILEGSLGVMGKVEE
ncbi:MULTISPECIES: hypothetical protein [Lactococcus]|uniref:hypothetical protein n=1 Tax=Lactococcus TaxID=1357 RepID=UPI0007CB9916|nr:hypothetical protein [Lactococcus formosensis]NHI64579.1 hypothetical protein [Lactococcus petauri]BAV02705.1 hypothetical protein NALG_1191 [Lactococcus formosensis]BDW48360.1 hypothetical protein LG21E20_00220 [Lactococcus formosensis]BDX23945.1 hypothetical protein LFMS200408A_00220 [Lactococcus formosensis]